MAFSKPHASLALGQWSSNTTFSSSQYEHTTLVGGSKHQIDSEPIPAQEQMTPGWLAPLNNVLSHFSHVWLSATVWTIACQAPRSLGFFRWEYWSGLPFSPPGDLSDPGTEPVFFKSPALAGRFCTTSATREAPLSKIHREKTRSYGASVKRQQKVSTHCNIMLTTL